MSEERKALSTMDDIMKQLEEGVETFFTSEKYTEYLKVLSRFHTYSVNNSLLIASQRPDATLVAGYRAWQTKFGRTVRTGERGLKIIAPVKEKRTEEVVQRDPTTHEILRNEQGEPIKKTVERQIPKFRVITVFDISQTEGKELPDIGVRQLEGSVTWYRDMMAAIRKVSPVPISIRAMEGPANGYYNDQTKEIVIKDGLSDNQTLKTAIHEVTHAKLHNRSHMKAHGVEKGRNEKEVEAESVAFVVCSRFGLDTSDYSFPYISSYSSNRSLAELRASMDVIRKTAGLMIESIETEMEQYRAEREGVRYEVWTPKGEMLGFEEAVPKYYEPVSSGKMVPERTEAELFRQLQSEGAITTGAVLVLYAFQTQAWMVDGDNLVPAELFALSLEKDPARMIPVLVESIDDLLYDYDVYSYMDLASSRDENREMLQKEMSDGNFRNVLEQLEIIQSGDGQPEYSARAELLMHKVAELEVAMDLPKKDPSEQISYFVAENMRFPVMGEYRETASLEEAKALYDAMPGEQFHGEKGIGAMIDNPGGYRSDVPMIIGGVLQRENRDNALFKENPLLEKAFSKLEDMITPAKTQPVRDTSIGEMEL